MNRRTDYDVVIAGCGPAGTHLALRLARAGHRIALLDRKRFPRSKPCGEFMSPECLPLLDELDLREAVVREGARPIGGLDLHGYGTVASGTFGRFATRCTYDFGYALRRERLDEISLRAAARQPSVDVFEGHHVVGLLRDAGGRVTGVEALAPDQHRLRLSAAFTVGADGMRSRVAKELGVRREVPWLQKFALVARFRGVPATTRAEVHYVDGGYLAACPVDGDLLTLNLVVERADLPGGRQQLADFVRDHVSRAPALAARLGNADLHGPVLGCGPLAATTTRQVAPGVALVGDACGYVDPMTGEGLYFAMRGAALLAPVLDAALRGDVAEAVALRRYSRRRRREFGPRIMMARLLQRGMRHPLVLRGVLAAMAARPLLADILVGMTSETLRWHDVLRPGILLDLLRNRRVPAA